MLLVLFLESAAHPQDSSQLHSSIDLDLSAGLGEVEEFAYAFTGELRFRNQAQLITLQVLYSREIAFSFEDSFFPSGGIRSSSPREDILNVGILYGLTKSFHLKRMLFPLFPLAIILQHEADYSISGSIGISVFKSVLRGEPVRQDFGNDSYPTYPEDRKFSFGVPVQFELVQYISPQLGYVHRFYYNFNSRQKFGGLLWGLQFDL